jgi:heme-degrading monooxygenase HmoA
MTKVHGTGGDTDAAIQTIRDTVVPRARELDGFRGFIGFVDRESETFMSFTLWESEEAMRASEEAANALRSDATKQIGATGEPTVKRFEVAVVDLPAAVAV